MKFLAIIEESMVNDLKIVVNNEKECLSHSVEVKPIQRPMIVLPDGKNVYITQEDLDELIEIIRKREMAKMFKERPFPHLKDSDLNMHLVMNDDGKWEVKNDERTE